MPGYREANARGVTGRSKPRLTLEHPAASSLWSYCPGEIIRSSFNSRNLLVPLPYFVPCGKFRRTIFRA
jgi:hypothetical protein